MYYVPHTKNMNIMSAECERMLEQKKTKNREKEGKA